LPGCKRRLVAGGAIDDAMTAGFGIANAEAEKARALAKSQGQAG
jgi:hypothetical protein